MAAGLAVGIALAVIAAVPVLLLLEVMERRRRRGARPVDDALRQDIQWAGVEAHWREFLAGLPVIEERQP